MAFVAFLGFLRWGIPFACARMDERADRLEKRELAADRKMNKRLEHVELELELFREATMKLIGRIAEVLPGDPVLVDVARMLRKRVPSPSMSLDELAEKLAHIPGGAKA